MTAARRRGPGGVRTGLLMLAALALSGALWAEGPLEARWRTASVDYNDLVYAEGSRALGASSGPSMADPARAPSGLSVASGLVERGLRAAGREAPERRRRRSPVDRFLLWLLLFVVLVLALVILSKLITYFLIAELIQRYEEARAAEEDEKPASAEGFDDLPGPGPDEPGGEAEEIAPSGPEESDATKGAERAPGARKPGGKK